MARAPGTDWVSPGGSSGVTQTIRVFDSARGAGTLRRAYQPARGGTSVRRVLEAGGHQVFRPKIGKGLTFTVDVRGANVVSEHARAFEQMIGPFIWSIQNMTGMYATALARSVVPVDTGATKTSIHHVMMTQAAGIQHGNISVEIGPTTFYSPFIEYGMGGHTHIGPRPFMTDTFFRIIPTWVKAFEELARIAKSGTRGKFETNPYAGELNAKLRQWRQHLYSIEKEIGDFMPLGLPLGIGGGFRSFLINSARSLGDIQSIVGRAVGARITRRLTGRVTGRLIGVGSNTVFASSEFTTRITGGQRVYNRVAGRAMTRFVDQSTFFRGLGG